MKIIDKISNRFKDSASRTKIVQKNILISSGTKICSLLISWFMVPITINYLSPEHYGLWMAITSILYWIAFMDIGLGNGMRNYMAEAIAKNDWDKARSYFSTAMVMLSIIAIILGIVAIAVIPFLNMNDIFNAHTISNKELAVVLLSAILIALMLFVAKNIGMAYVALQQYAVNDIIVFLGSVISAISILILSHTVAANLTIFVVAVSLPPVLVYILAIIPLIVKHPQLRPCLKAVDFEVAKQVISKGLGFFVIQITSCLVLFGSANLFISHYCGPEQVTIYNVAYKLFSLLYVAYLIYLSPIWNAYTDAAAKKDYGWIKHMFRRSMLMWGLSILGGCVLLAISGWFFKIWVGNSVTIPFMVSLAVMLYICAFNLNNATTYLLNGLNTIRMQIITSVSITLIYVLTLALQGSRMGIVSITACMTAAYLIMALIHGYQCHLLINNKAHGIWKM